MVYNGGSLLAFIYLYLVGVFIFNFVIFDNERPIAARGAVTFHNLASPKHI